MVNSQRVGLPLGGMTSSANPEHRDVEPSARFGTRRIDTSERATAGCPLRRQASRQASLKTSDRSARVTGSRTRTGPCASARTTMQSDSPAVVTDKSDAEGLMTCLVPGRIKLPADALEVPVNVAAITQQHQQVEQHASQRELRGEDRKTGSAARTSALATRARGRRAQ